MYEDILKFLKDKNRKLTKEEATEFIRLLAESVGCEEDIMGHNSSLENSEEEFSTDINFVIDDINEGYSEDEDTFSLEGISDEEEEEKEYIVLNKRKIMRNKEFKRVKTLQETSVKEASEEAIKSDIEVLSTEKQNLIDKNIDHECNESAKEENLLDKSHENSSKQSDVLFNLPKTLNFSSGNFLASEESPSPNLPNDAEFSLPKLDKSFEFKLPDATCTNEEFKFDVGELLDINKNGPDFKFYDEDNNEI